MKRKKGSIDSYQLAMLIIGGLVLVSVFSFLGYIFFSNGGGIAFFKQLPTKLGFGSKEVVVEQNSPFVRYSIVNDQVEYRHGGQWNLMSSQEKIEGIVRDPSVLKEEFVNYWYLSSREEGLESAKIRFIQPGSGSPISDPLDAIYLAESPELIKGPATYTGVPDRQRRGIVGARYGYLHKGNVREYLFTYDNLLYEKTGDIKVTSIGSSINTQILNDNKLKFDFDAGMNIFGFKTGTRKKIQDALQHDSQFTPEMKEALVQLKLFIERGLEFYQNVNGKLERPTSDVVMPGGSFLLKYTGIDSTKEYYIYQFYKGENPTGIYVSVYSAVRTNDLYSIVKLDARSEYTKSYGTKVTLSSAEAGELKDALRIWRNSVLNKPILVKEESEKAYCVLYYEDDPAYLVVDFSAPVNKGVNCGIDGQTT